MPSVKCPECGERVRYFGDDVKLRCPDCGMKFRAGSEQDEEDRPRSRRKKAPARSYNAVLIAGLVGGFVLLVVVGGAVAFLAVRGKDGNNPPGGGNAPLADGNATPGGGNAPLNGEEPGFSEKVLIENYKKVDSAMSIEDIERILGPGRKVSDSEARDEYKRSLPAGRPFRRDPTPIPTRMLEWRLWKGGDVRIWMAFADTKYGKLSCFGTCRGGSINSSFSNGEIGLEKELEKRFEARKRVADIRKDTKWVRGAQGKALIPGEWRNENGVRMQLYADGRVRGGRSYRILSDTQLEIPQPAPWPVFLYDYFVNQDELALVDVTNSTTISWSQMLFYYRMPANPGSAVYNKIFRPLITDANSPDEQKSRPALDKLVRFGKHGLPALREVQQAATTPDRKLTIQHFVDAAEQQATKDEQE